MIVLGLDPGLARVGYGVVRKDTAGLTAVDYGCITTEKTLPIPSRLMSICEDLEKIIERVKPDAVAIEQLFYFKNEKTLIAVSEARGVLLCTCQRKVLPISEYTPLQIKQALTGDGRAPKEQVQKMVAITVRLKDIPKPDDASDALATSICHLQSMRLE
ncbi:crossover junction endodeoxyribonuclease RuvC [Patescibacteria group bacterium]|nr:crossover junction endodeoxyribonuclease RuvC [Patescibacteria group bacterium]